MAVVRAEQRRIDEGGNLDEDVLGASGEWRGGGVLGRLFFVVFWFEYVVESQNC